jgi:four helix bundle protein
VVGETNKERNLVNKPHKKLDAWKLSIELAHKIYQLTEGFTASEKFGLVSQMRRCAVSVPSNISEGAARDSSKEFRRFVSIARSSLSELDTQLDVSLKLGLTTLELREALDPLLSRIDKLFHGLHKSLNSSNP